MFLSIFLCAFALLCGAAGCGDDNDAEFKGSNTGSGGTAGDGDSGDGDSGDGDSGDGDGDMTSAPIVKPDKFDAGSDENRNRVTPGSICERLSTIQCAGEAWCCDSRTRTEAACKATMLKGCNDDLLLDDIAMRSVVGFDAAHAFDAFTMFEQLAAACDPVIATFGASREGLLGMQKGTLGTGAVCKENNNVLGAAAAGAALASCSDPENQSCLPRSFLGAWMCEPRTADGACFSDSNCIDGAFCDNPDLMIGNSCEPRRADGQSCSAANNCISLTCEGGSCTAATAQTAYCLQ